MIDIKTLFTAYFSKDYTQVKKSAEELVSIDSKQPLYKVNSQIDDYIASLRDHNTFRIRSPEGTDVRVLTDQATPIDNNVPQQMAAHYLKAGLLSIDTKGVTKTEFATTEAARELLYDNFRKLVQQMDDNINLDTNVDPETMEKRLKLNYSLVTEWVEWLKNNLNTDAEALLNLKDCAALISRDEPVFHVKTNQDENGNVTNYEADLSQSVKVDSKPYLQRIIDIKNDSNIADGEAQLQQELTECSDPENDLYWLAQKTVDKNGKISHGDLVKFFYDNAETIVENGMPAPTSAGWLPWQRNIKKESNLKTRSANDITNKNNQLTHHSYRHGMISPAGMKKPQNKQEWTKPDKNANQSHEFKSRVHYAYNNLQEQFKTGLRNIDDYLDKYSQMNQSGDTIQLNILYQTLVSPTSSNEDLLWANEKIHAFNEFQEEQKENSEFFRNMVIESLGGSQRANYDPEQKLFRYYPDQNDSTKYYYINPKLLTTNLPMNLGRLVAQGEHKMFEGQKKETSQQLINSVADELKKLSNAANSKDNNGSYVYPNLVNRQAVDLDQYFNKNELVNDMSRELDILRIADYFKDKPHPWDSNKDALEIMDLYVKILKNGHLNTQLLKPDAQYELAMKIESARQLKHGPSYSDYVKFYQSGFYNHLDHHPVRKAAQQAFCVGSQGAVFGGCKSAKDRTSPYLATIAGYFKNFDHLFNTFSQDKAHLKRHLHRDNRQRVYEHSVEALTSGFYHQANALNGMGLKLKSVDKMSKAFAKPLKAFDKKHKGAHFHLKNREGEQFANKLESKLKKKKAIHKSVTQLEQDHQFLQACYRAYLSRIRHGHATADNTTNETLINAYRHIAQKATSLESQIDRLYNADNWAKRIFIHPLQKKARTKYRQKLQTMYQFNTANPNQADQKTAILTPDEKQESKLRANIQSQIKEGQKQEKKPYNPKNNLSYFNPRKPVNGSQDTYEFTSSYKHTGKFFQKGSTFEIGPTQTLQDYQQKYAKSPKRLSSGEYLEKRQHSKTKPFSSLFQDPRINKAYKSYVKNAFDQMGDQHVPSKSYLQTAAETIENFVVANKDNDKGEPEVNIHKGETTDPALYQALALYCEKAGITWKDHTGYAKKEEIQNQSELIDQSRNDPKLDKYQEITDIMSEFGRNPPEKDSKAFYLPANSGPA